MQVQNTDTVTRSTTYHTYEVYLDIDTSPYATVDVGRRRVARAVECQYQDRIRLCQVRSLADSIYSKSS